MHRIALRSASRSYVRPRVVVLLSRRLHSQYEDKYSEQLQKVAEQQGLSVSELKQKLQLEQESKRRERAVPPIKVETDENARQDSSPVKPLSSILNIPRILASPHTAEQVEALWTVYHASRSEGTGRGYLCASIPVDLYNQMASRAAKYPMFVIPIRRDKDAASTTTEAEAAHEFYFLQWAFHGPPPVPSLTDDDLFSPPSAKKPPATADANPQISTVMLTPLQEYKMRGSFATPYLVLTNYTDLASSHGVVLLRGEITPSAATGGAGVDGRYMLRQDDAHRLTMSVQNFYLSSGEGSLERAKLLQAFHEAPNEFKWEELLKHAI
ncbi:protein ATP11, mitochondrial [Favolaschia claudopus]|uniref:Protein ATP11, mitochondrial n=1 Tax=Favolaschia claudopus TaxID=2862362 RepID=A0AAW0EGK8_9AGAR